MEPNKFFHPDDDLSKKIDEILKKFTKGSWQYCSCDLSFEEDIQSAFIIDRFTEEWIDEELSTAQKIKALKFVYELDNLTDIEWT